MEGAPVCCAPNTTAAEAARLMKQHHIGDVLIRDDGRLTGIVTDRDLAVRVLAEDVPPAERTLGEICSADVAWVSPDDDVHRVVQLMKERAVRRLPVCEDDGRLVGVVSIGDIAIDRDRQSVLGRISAAPPNG
jgi:CBS domain-containing protein